MPGSHSSTAGKRIHVRMVSRRFLSPYGVTVEKCLNEDELTFCRLSSTQV